MVELIPEIDAPAAVVMEFREGLRCRAALAAIAQEKLNAAMANEESRLLDGVGQLVTRVDADVYWLMRQKFGEDCWKDKAFRKDCENKGLTRRVRGRADAVSLRMPGFKPTFPQAQPPAFPVAPTETSPLPFRNPPSAFRVR